MVGSGDATRVSRRRCDGRGCGGDGRVRGGGGKGSGGSIHREGYAGNTLSACLGFSRSLFLFIALIVCVENPFLAKTVATHSVFFSSLLSLSLSLIVLRARVASNHVLFLCEFIPGIPQHVPPSFVVVQSDTAYVQ